MSQFFKSKIKLGLALAVVFTVVTLLMASVAHQNRDLIQLPEETVAADAA